MNILIKYKNTKIIMIFFYLFFCTILFINSQEWIRDYDEAQKLAVKLDRNIILVFQGSDWCRPCIKLTRDLWTSNEFKSYAKEHFIMLLADFPRKKKNRLSDIQKKKNIKLIEKYHKAGYFPFIVVLDKNGNILGRTGYKKLKPSEYIKLLSSF